MCSNSVVFAPHFKPAYLDQYEIQAAQDHSALSGLCVQALDHGVVGSYEEIATRFNAIANVVQESFATASLEPKLTNREELMQRTTPAKAPPLSKKNSSVASAASSATDAIQKVEKPQIMRKLMTRVVAEMLEQDKRVVYVGEDVEHGMFVACNCCGG